MDDTTFDLLAVLAYEHEISIAALAARTGIPLDAIESALASDDIFDVAMIGDEPVTVRLTNFGYQLARGAIFELAA